MYAESTAKILTPRFSLFYRFLSLRCSESKYVTSQTVIDPHNSKANLKLTYPNANALQQKVGVPIGLENSFRSFSDLPWLFSRRPVLRWFFSSQCHRSETYHLALHGGSFYKSFQEKFVSQVDTSLPGGKPLATDFERKIQVRRITEDVDVEESLAGSFWQSLRELSSSPIPSTQQRKRVQRTEASQNLRAQEILVSTQSHHTHFSSFPRTNSYRSHSIHAHHNGWLSSLQESTLGGFERLKVFFEYSLSCSQSLEFFHLEWLYGLPLAFCGGMIMEKRWKSRRVV